MDDALNRFLMQLFSYALFMLVIIYAFACMILGPKRAQKTVGSLFTGIAKGAIRVTGRMLKILFMFVINLTTMVIRMAGRPDQTQNAWAVFVERMSDVILG